MYHVKVLARNTKLDEQIYLSTAGKGLRTCIEGNDTNFCESFFFFKSIPVLFLFSQSSLMAHLHSLIWILIPFLYWAVGIGFCI